MCESINISIFSYLALTRHARNTCEHVRLSNVQTNDEETGLMLLSAGAQSCRM